MSLPSHDQIFYIARYPISSITCLPYSNSTKERWRFSWEAKDLIRILEVLNCKSLNHEDLGDLFLILLGLDDVISQVSSCREDSHSIDEILFVHTNSAQRNRIYEGSIDHLKEQIVNIASNPPKWSQEVMQGCQLIKWSNSSFYDEEISTESDSKEDSSSDKAVMNEPHQSESKCLLQ